MNEPLGAKFKLINFDYLDFKKMYFGEKRFYCYILLDPRFKTDKWSNGTPFYVGKGTRRRALTHLSKTELSKDIYKTRKIKNIINENQLVNIEIKFPFSTTEVSCEEEKIFIKNIKQEGIELCNFTDGGEGRCGIVVSDETKRKMSESKSKEYVLISPEGKIMYIKGLSRFCRINRLSKARLNQIARSRIGVEYKGDTYKNKKYEKKNLTHKGWTCFYKKNFSEEKINQKRYIIKNENGEELEKVQTLEEFSKRKGISCACLRRYALKQGKVYKGFRVEINPNY
jgi:hypothetical protein